MGFKSLDRKPVVQISVAFPFLGEDFGQRIQNYP